MATKQAAAQMAFRSRATGSASITHPQLSSEKADYDLIHALRFKAINLFNCQLTKDERKKIDVQACPRGSLSDLLQAAKVAKDKAEQARYPWTETVQKIFRQVNHYAVAGDMVVQHHAEYTSLVWGAFRFLLLFTVEEANSSEKLSEALDSIIQSIYRAEEYAKLFSSHSGSSTERVFQSLQDNLTRLYAEILGFLIRATKFFEKHTLRRYVSAGFSSFDGKFQNILEQIVRHEGNIEKDIHLLESEDEKLQQTYENGVWLQHADFTSELKKFQQVHVSGTCDWFLTSDAYVKWKESSSTSSASHLLWIQGKPGSGKSTLAAQINQDLQSHGNNNIILSIFCRDGEENKNTLGSVLRNLTFQLLEQSPPRKEFHQRVQAARLNEKSQFVQSMETLWAMLESMLRESKQVYGILDGLDECNSSPTDLVPFLHRLTKAFKIDSDGHGGKLMVISRLDQLGTGKDLALWDRVQIHSSNVRQDIERIASIRVEESRVLSIHPEKKDILQALVDGSDGMILWAELMIKDLEAGHWNVQSVLQNPPRGLSEVYTAILHRISARKGSLARIQHALQLILAAARPLRLEELAVGLAVADGLRCHEDYDRRGDPIAESLEIILESSPLLIRMPDGTVQLAHTSLKEYLCSSQKPSSLAEFRFQLADVHSRVASILISYLSFECFAGDHEEQMQSKHYFLEYASLWLVHHATKAENCRQTAAKLVSFSSVTQGWKWAERLMGEYDISIPHLHVMQSGLRLWAQTLQVDRSSWDILSSFLLILARSRYDELKESLPLDHPSVLTAMTDLGQAYYGQGQLKEAEELFIQVSEAQKKVFGQEHPSSLPGMTHLAPLYLTLLYLRQKRSKEAEELILQVIDTEKNVFGQEHPYTLGSMGNLVSIYKGQRRLKEAEELVLRVIEMRKKILGHEHPETLKSMGSLASIYLDQGRLKEAEELILQVIEMQEKVFGLVHQNTLLSMYILALAYKAQGRDEEAIGLLKQVLTSSSYLLGSEHPDSTSSKQTLYQWQNGT